MNATRFYRTVLARWTVLLFFTFNAYAFAKGIAQKIVVESSAKQGSAVLVKARLGDKQIELTCSLTESGCRVLGKGAYLVGPEKAVFSLRARDSGNR